MPVSRRFLKLLFSLGLYLTLATASHAAERLFDFTGELPVQGGGVGLGLTVTASGVSSSNGAKVDVPMPGGQVLQGTVIEERVAETVSTDRQRANATSTIVVSLDDNQGGVEMHMVNDSVVGITIINAPSRQVFAASIDGNGRGVLIEADADSYFCVAMPVAPADSRAAERAPLASVPPLSELQNLQGRPGASKTLFIDYWGGTVSGTAWNVNFNGGADIDYTPFSTDSNTSNFSTNEQYLMYLGWLETVEDFSPFDVNVTTSRAVYDATPQTQRSRIISTQTNYFYTGAGGVAYLNVFGNPTDYLTTGWTWNSTAGSHGMTISHEAGHQMGLGHDGLTSGSTYYGGHGQWGPIMGAPFNKPYVHWSKGEYDNANENQDDVAIISGKLNTIADDVAGSTGFAQFLSPPVDNATFHITPGSSPIDTDMFRFDLPVESTVDLRVIPWLGAEGETRAGNLAISVELKDDNGATIAAIGSGDVVPLSPVTNEMLYSQTLPAGTYFVSVVGESPIPNWSTGFGSYGHGGFYNISLSADYGAPGQATLVSPTGSITNSNPVFTWNAVPGASWYRIWLNGPGGTTDQWISAEAVGCAGGGVDCQLDLQTTLPPGAHSWWIQTYGNAAEGPWSDGLSFAVIDGGPPIAPTISAPDYGETVTTGPVANMTWVASPTATWYQLWVQDTDGALVHAQWYPASEHCNPASGLCSVSFGGDNMSPAMPATPPGVSGIAPAPASGSQAELSESPAVFSAGGGIMDGVHTWHVLGWNSAGSTWSVEGLFNASQGGLLPRMTSPVPFSVLFGSTAEFVWTPNGAQVDQYWLTLGTSRGATELHNQSHGSNLTATVNGVPAGTLVWARLWWQTGGSWSYADYKFNTAEPN